MGDRRAAGISPPRPLTQAAVAPASQAMTLFVMIVATLYFGKDVLMPVTLALLLAFVLAPMVNLLRRAHLGRVPSVLLGVLVLTNIGLPIASSRQRCSRRRNTTIEPGKLARREAQVSRSRCVIVIETAAKLAYGQCKA
jgi:hypothetical protein